LPSLCRPRRIARTGRVPRAPRPHQPDNNSEKGGKKIYSRVGVRGRLKGSLELIQTTFHRMSSILCFQLNYIVGYSD
jgi:hypothetical protein